MKILFTALFTAVTFLKGYSQNNYINWHDNTKIRWADFKGVVETSSPFAAMSAVGINYKYNSVSKGKAVEVSFEINAAFDKTKSWSKRSEQTVNTLKHEQLHFDICEVVSREFRKEAEQTVYTKNYKNEITRIFNRYTRELQKLQKKYDDQTRHSKNKTKQKEWENLIHQELAR
ncbi:DUF922 domain-containing protein [Segetibacter aerophilus]|uniref:DUF922 domain-containing protein n=1 Tax=Segetibacter aerophilus TaxID=670293 RepID=A0A512BG00_9BACT|nr:hypothetical protein [Segetibacter aerophilus]GEO10805.1 hypothetical protein SAE01_33010 [Segetibacter aerophilus]